MKIVLWIIVLIYVGCLLAKGVDLTKKPFIRKQEVMTYDRYLTGDKGSLNISEVEPILVGPQMDVVNFLTSKTMTDRLIRGTIISFHVYISGTLTGYGNGLDLTKLTYGEGAQIVVNSTDPDLLRRYVDPFPDYMAKPVRRVPMVIVQEYNNFIPLRHLFYVISSHVGSHGCSISELIKGKLCKWLNEDLHIDEHNQEAFRDNKFGKVNSISGCFQIVNTSLSDKDLLFLTTFDPSRILASCIHGDGNYIVNNSQLCTFSRLKQFKRIPSIWIHNSTNAKCQLKQIVVKTVPNFFDHPARNLCLIFFVVTLLMGICGIINARRFFVNFTEVEKKRNVMTQEISTALKSLQNKKIDKSLQIKIDTVKRLEQHISNDKAHQQWYANLGMYSMLVFTVSFMLIYFIVVASAHRRSLFFIIKTAPFW